MKILIITLRKYIYITLFLVDRILGNKNKLVVFSYHSISKNKNFYSVPETDFKKQIKQILKTYKPISLVDLNNYFTRKKEIAQPSFILTFDDGYRDVLKVKSFINAFGIKPSIFVLSDSKKIRRDVLKNNSELLTIKDIKDLIRTGWEIGSHSATHTLLTGLKESELKKEVLESKKILEKLLSIKVKYFAYPKGKYSKQVLSSVKRADYNLALSMDDELINKYSDKFKIPRVGVNGTHSLSEFKTLASPTVIKFRKLAKQMIGGIYEQAT